MRAPKLTAGELAKALGHARTATAMHWHDDVARHVGTARKLSRELGDGLREGEA